MRIIVYTFFCLIAVSHSSFADELDPVRTYLHKAESFVGIYVKPLADGYDSNLLRELVDEDAISMADNLQRQSLDIFLIAHKHKGKVESSGICNFSALDVSFASLRRSLSELLECRQKGCPDKRPESMRHRYRHYYEDLRKRLDDCNSMYIQEVDGGGGRS